MLRKCGDSCEYSYIMSKTQKKRISPPASPSPLVEKEEARSKIASKEFSLVPKEGSSNSTVWDSFFLVVNSTSQEFMNYVSCKQCIYLYKFKKGSSPTTLVRHRCSAKENTPEASVVDIEVSDETKVEIIEKLVLLCARDLRPFNIVEGEGFRDVLQRFTSIGAKYGS